MDNLHITGTFKIPEVYFSVEGQLHIRGIAFIPPEPWLVMDRLFKWVQEYSLNPAPSTVMSIAIGITGRKCWRKFMTLVETIAMIQDENHAVYVAWYVPEYEEPEFKEYIGQWLANLGVHFDLIEVDEIR